MPLVQGTEVGPAGQPHRDAWVHVRLVASTNGPAPGYDLTGDVAIHGDGPTRTNQLGEWSVDLKPNSAITPAGTVYTVEVTPPGRPAIRHTISVPDGAGPYRVEDILTDPPAALSSSALAVHAADSALHGGSHPDLDTHDVLGLATDAALATHAATSHGLPWLININPWGGTAISQVGWSEVVLGTYVAGNAHLRCTAQNSEVNFDVVLAAGTWTVEASVIAGTGRGIITFALDGTDIGTYDTYAATSDFKARGGVSGVVVATSTKRRLRLKAATKNASSSAYMVDLVWLQLRRTA